MIARLFLSGRWGSHVFEPVYSDRTEARVLVLWVEGRVPARVLGRRVGWELSKERRRHECLRGAVTIGLF